MDNEKFRQFIIFISVVAGIGLMFYGAMTPPPGEISNSILVMCGEIMLFVCGIMGVSDIATKFLGKITEKIAELKEINSEKNDENKT